MTRSEHEVPELLEQLSEGTPLELDAFDENERRQRIARAVDERLDRLAAARARKRRRVFAAGLAAAFTAGAAAAYVVLRPPATENVVATVTSDRPIEVRHHGAAQSTASTRLEVSDEIHTPNDATTTAILTNGASVEVDPDSTVRFDAHVDPAEYDGQDLRLTQGTVSLRVPKLGPHRTLSVVTPDARVTVRGTRFSVSVFGADAQRETRVHVTQGSVWVDHAGKEDVLSAGQSWSSRPELAGVTGTTTATGSVTATGSANAGATDATGSAATGATTATGSVNATDTTSATGGEGERGAVAANGVGHDRQSAAHRNHVVARGRTMLPGDAVAAGSAAVDSTAPGARRASSGVAASSGVTASSATVAVEGAPAASATHADEAGSTLTAENELYRRAVSSVRGSDDSRAVGLLDTFLVRFPRSPLAQNAEVERLRALERLGRHDAAVHAAQQYLSAYPRGFASEEARRLLAPAGTER